MSNTDQFWQYVKEVILSACGAKTNMDKKGLLELARFWTQAALQERAFAYSQTGRGRRRIAFGQTTCSRQSNKK